MVPDCFLSGLLSLRDAIVERLVLLLHLLELLLAPCFQGPVLMLAVELHLLKLPVQLSLDSSHPESDLYTGAGIP